MDYRVLECYYDKKFNIDETIVGNNFTESYYGNRENN